MNINQYRAHRANLITARITACCALAFVAALIPTVEHAVTVVLIVAAGLAVVATMARLVARWVRERREDREDALTAAAWRTEHARHLLGVA